MSKNPHAVALGKKKSTKKAEAARENGKKGGRPKKQTFKEWSAARDSRAITPNPLGF